MMFAYFLYLLHFQQVLGVEKEIGSAIEVFKNLAKTVWRSIRRLFLRHFFSAIISGWYLKITFLYHWNCRPFHYKYS